MKKWRGSLKNAALWKEVKDRSFPARAQSCLEDSNKGFA